MCTLDLRKTRLSDAVFARLLQWKNLRCSNIRFFTVLFSIWKTPLLDREFFRPRGFSRVPFWFCIVRSENVKFFIWKTQLSAEESRRSKRSICSICSICKNALVLIWQNKCSDYTKFDIFSMMVLKMLSGSSFRGLLRSTFDRASISSISSISAARAGRAGRACRH